MSAYTAPGMRVPGLLRAKKHVSGHREMVVLLQRKKLKTLENGLYKVFPGFIFLCLDKA